MSDPNDALNGGIPTLEGIEAQTLTTRRIRSRVLLSGPADGVPVLFIHGNFSSATWWEETMTRLPPRYRAIAPDQRGFGEADPSAKVDARNGMGDLAEDALALMDHLGHQAFHLVGNSLGGLVAWWMMAHCPERLMSVTLPGPGSPFGFGGTRDEIGTPVYEDFAGSGAGLLNRELLRNVSLGDRGTDSPFSPRTILRLLVWGPPFIPAREDDLLEATLRIHLGEQDMPGDHISSPNWPGFAPGIWGVGNAMSPKYSIHVRERILKAGPKPDVLWIYGDEDVAISNTAASDPGTRGLRGLLNDYPGIEQYPPQPMMDQIRQLLEDYRATGGRYREVAVKGSGHVPFMSDPEWFDRAFHAHLEHGVQAE